MQKTIIFLLLVIAFHEAKAQPDSLSGFQFPPKESFRTKIEHGVYVIGASLAYSLVDYIGYNLVRKENKAPISFRIGMIALQSGLSYFLYKQCGLNSAISFNLIWWTWSDDFAYYGWANTLNPSFLVENRSVNGLKQGGITWAWWTPVGLLRKKGSEIAVSTLIAQAVVGFSIAVALF
jgi:hypothetical protein